MRPAELLALAACALVADSAVAHGVHDLRGVLRFETERLVIEVESGGDRGDERVCLRLLNELRVQAGAAGRLTGTERQDLESGRCRLVYPLTGESETLVLQLRSRRRGALRHERLILLPQGETGARGEPLVLSNRGGETRIEVPG